MKETEIKTTIINYVLWAAFLLAMISSVQHIAWTFGTVEQPGREWLGWIPALAVDAGLAALAYTIQQRRKVKRSTSWHWVGVVVFALISALANLYHALVVESGGITSLAAIGAIDSLLIAKAIFLSATLPLLVVYLSEIVSGDDATAAKASDDEKRKSDARAERAERRADLAAERERAEAQRLLLEAENERTRLALAAEAATVSEPAAGESFACPHCERTYKTRNALNAHVGRAHSDAEREPSEPPSGMSDAGSNGKVADPEKIITL